MNRLREAVTAIAGNLERQGQSWALVGGLAVSAQVQPRFTRDIDLAVAVPDDMAAEQLVLRLQAGGYRLGMALEQTAVGRLATVRLLPPGETDEGVLVDLMFASSGIEAEICRDAHRIELFEGLTVPVCRPGHLVALKILARDDLRRPQDIVDIRALLAHMDHLEQAHAREGLALIEARGFHRGRDLLAAFEVLLDAAGPEPPRT